MRSFLGLEDDGPGPLQQPREAPREVPRAAREPVPAPVRPAPPAPVLAAPPAAVPPAAARMMPPPDAPMAMAPAGMAPAAMAPAAVAPVMPPTLAPAPPLGLGKTRQPPAPVPQRSRMRAVIGDQLRRPALLCEFSGCANRYTHPDALGERQLRDLALAAGWQYDVIGRLACPSCVMHAPTFWSRRPQAVSGQGE